MSRRKSPIFSRDTSIASGESVPDWFSDFARNLEKTSVQSREQDSSVYDQISEIMGHKKSKYSTVEDAVRDYRERTGLGTYIKNLSRLENLAHLAESVKKASLQEDVEFNGAVHVPESLKKIEGAPLFAQKYIESYFGGISPTAVAQAMHNHFAKDGFTSDLQDDPEVLKYISNLLAEYQSQNKREAPASTQAGIVDTDIGDNSDNEDAFAILQPAKS